MLEGLRVFEWLHWVHVVTMESCIKSDIYRMRRGLRQEPLQMACQVSLRGSVGGAMEFRAIHMTSHPPIMNAATPSDACSAATGPTPPYRVMDIMGPGVCESGSSQRGNHPTIVVSTVVH